MAKRPVSDSDGDSEEAGPSHNGAKRARLSSPTSDVDTPKNDTPPASRTGDKGSFTREEWEDLEKSYIPQIEVRRRAAEGRIGRVADFGIIERVELCQFMCHTYLTFDFGSQLNFIVGHNGSGKSAILAGISVGLGGKAAATGRGTGVKSLIKEGSSKAEVTITIKNAGDNAYEPEIFGNKIIVIRTISRNGSSTYKLKSASGKIVSNRKADLDSICNYLEIQVDNPISILTQDSAKTFLKNSSPEYMYKLFMQGTYLEKLREDYEATSEYNTTISKFLLEKKDYADTLKEKCDIARKAYDESKEAQDLRSRRRRLLIEMAWALVSEKETELETAFENVRLSESRLAQIEIELDKSQALYKKVSDKIQRMDENHEDVKRATQSLWDQRDVVKRDLAERKKEFNDFKSDEKEIERSLQETQDELTELAKKVIQESQDLEEAVQARKEAVRIEAAGLREKIDELKVRRATIQLDCKTLARELSEAEFQRSQVKTDLDARRKEERDLKESYQKFQSQMEDPLSQYGKNMQDVMKFIDDTQWRGQKPMGPLGIFVRLENADYWNVMRQHIGKLLLSFAVTDSRDIGPLRAILKRTKNFDTRILVSSGDLFDYSQGEPPAQYLTALRLLKISNPWVTRLLIDHAGIERIYVAPTRKEAEEILKERGDGVALSGMGHKLTRWRIDGGNKSEAIRELPVKDPRSSLFRQQINQSDEIEKMIRRGKELQLAIDSLQLSENRLDEQMRGMQERSSQFQATGRALDAEIRREEEELRLKLEEDQADSPVTLAVLEQLKEEKESEKESFAEQLAHVSSQKRDMAPHVMALQRKVDALKGDAEASEEKRQQIVAELATEAGALAQAHKDKQHYEDKKTAEQGKLVGLRVVADEITAAFTELDGKASGFSEREVTTRSSQAVELEITNLNNTLSRYEARQAKSSAQLERELEVVKKVHDDHVKLWNMLWKIYEALQQAIQSRRDKWFKFLAYFSASCKAQFMYHLSSRGYFGQVQFKHIEQRLELRVQKDDQAYERHEETQEADNRRKKDPASLSGGEKSLATLCLLLSMWDVGSIPIRCLDEFDVYMDNQNRRCCIKMLTDAAKSSAGRQTIIITPQSIDNVFSEPPVVLIKQMADPRASTIP